MRSDRDNYVIVDTHYLEVALHLATKNHMFRLDQKEISQSSNQKRTTSRFLTNMVDSCIMHLTRKTDHLWFKLIFPQIYQKRGGWKFLYRSKGSPLRLHNGKQTDLLLWHENDQRSLWMSWSDKSVSEKIPQIFRQMLECQYEMRKWRITESKQLFSLHLSSRIWRRLMWPKGSFEYWTLDRQY